MDVRDALETDREVMKPGSFSLSGSKANVSSVSSVFSGSSHGSSSISSGDRLLSDEGCSGSDLHSLTSSSIDICRGDTADNCRACLRLGGIAVTASRAATAGGSAFGS